MYLGIQLVIAKSYARIHRANLINFGILPLKFSHPEDYERIDRRDRLLLENAKKYLEGHQPFMILNQTKKYSFEVIADFNNREKEILLTGGLLAHAKKSPLSI
jgi:aconitate hydratase